MQRRLSIHATTLIRSLIVALFLISITVAVVSTEGRVSQGDGFVSVMRQELVDVQGPAIKTLEIDLRQPRFIKTINGVNFDERKGAKRHNPFLPGKDSFESEVLEIPFDRCAISLVWSGENGVSVRVQGYFRTSKNLTNWSDWIAAESAGDEFSSGSLFESGSVAVPAGAKYLQLRIELSSDELGSGPSVERVTLNYTALEKSPTRAQNTKLQSQTEPESTYLSSVSTQAVSTPTIISRTEWGCPDGEVAPSAPPEPNTPVTHLIVHHTLTGTRPRNPNDYKRWVYNIWNEHKNGKGWGDIGYNLLIDPQGNIYEGRAGGVDAKGFHFSCHNTHTTGIALLGDFTSTLPTAKALVALKQVLAWRAQAWDIDPQINTILYSPLASVPDLDIPSIAGHRNSNPVTWSCDDTDARTCPGDALYAALPSIRNGVAQIMAPGFSVQVQPIYRSIFLMQGQQINIGLDLHSYGGFSGTVSISMSGLPAGVTVTPNSVFLPANGSVSTTLTVKSSLSTPTGLFSPTITGVAGGIQRSTKLSITITGAPGSITVNALNNGVAWAGNVNYTLVGPQGVVSGFSVPLTTSNLPAGAYTLSYNSGGPGSFTKITPVSTQTLVAGGSLTFTLNFGNPVSTLTVKCSASPSVITVGQSSTFSATASGGVGPYLYTWSGAITGNSPSTTKSFSTTGTFSATVKVSDGSLQGAQATCSVQVNSSVPASFDLYDFVSAQTAQAGQSASFDLYLQPQNGFASQVSFSLAGLPSGASMTSSSVLSVSGTSAIHYVLVIKTSTSTPVGVFPFTITANGGGVTRTASLTLTVTAPPPQPLSASCRITPNPITLGQGATASAQGAGGVLPYRYRIAGVDTGTVSSLLVMPSQVGTFTVAVVVFDSQNQQASASCSAQVVAADPYLTGFNYSPNPAKATQRVDLNIYGGNFNTTTEVWFVGPGCTAPGCKTNAVTVTGNSYIAAAAVLNLVGTYTVNIRNGSGTWVKVGTVTVVQ